MPRVFPASRSVFVGFLTVLWLGSGFRPGATAADAGNLTFRPLPQGRFHLEGLVADRVKSNVDAWLLPAPHANPGMLEMFRVRDREPRPNLVPWAGEFVGKYLISAIQTLRLVERPDLRAEVTRTVRELLLVQAEDGYLGPFQREVRLKENWDLWGHYHIMLGLLMWHEATGDTNSLQACRRAADLVCATYLDSGRRVFDAGSHEMNMAMVHGLGRLYRLTQEPRYLRMMREIEKDWERAGDYLRTGVNGIEFFQTPRPRWESLHDLQGLVEFYRITGDMQYRRAFEQHWRSILRWDRRNTGGFSSGEQATGNPYAPTPIETCCTVAWMALTADMLHLTGDARAADELELSFYNGALGAQHPTGRWSTYNTPMDGVREASAHTIVFQSRAGTPELNCCSVNAPRGLGVLSEWGVLAGENALIVNYYGPGTFQGKLADNTPVALTWSGSYPLSDTVTLRVEPVASRRFRLLLRIPSWSTHSSVALNGKALPDVISGAYLELNRRWDPGDRISLQFDMRVRAVPGDREALGRVSLYRGPLLLAYDQALNTFDPKDVPAVDLGRLSEIKEASRDNDAGRDALAPWLVLDVPAEGGRSVRVCDFASAGAKGTSYRSWLPARQSLPPVVVTRWPADGARVPKSGALFRWTGPKRTNEYVSEYRLIISRPSDPVPIISLSGLHANRLSLDEAALRPLEAGTEYGWKVIAVNASGSTPSVTPASRFTVDSALPKVAVGRENPDPNAPLLVDRLAGKPAPTGATLLESTRFLPPSDKSLAVRTDGTSGMIRYRVEEFPDEDYALSVWVNPMELPAGRLAQVFSAWSAPSDDPLRVCFDHGKVFARIEAGQAYSTGGVALPPGQWSHLAVVKSGTDLTLFVNGEKRGHTTVPLFISTQAEEVGLGGNPRYSGNEYLAAEFARLAFYGRALGPDEIRALAADQR